MAEDSRVFNVIKSTSLHWLHWLVVICSLLLTLGAWMFATYQAEQKIYQQFDYEASRVVDLIQERMNKYELALQSGVATINALDNDIDHLEWKHFADTLQIERAYPGINGIGVIYSVMPQNLDDFLAKERKLRPNFTIKPLHKENEYWPITFIEPANTNLKALGLDMAHETNRFVAAKKARDTGKAQVTGPIILVQDSKKTPGFLFYAPFYDGALPETIEARQKHFVGMVYAPFIMNNLMIGALGHEKRLVNIRINDGDVILYDEHSADFEDYDSDALFEKNVEVMVYGRPWLFNIQSAQSFRALTQTNQPLVILVCGLLIDILLFVIFVVLSRSNKKAVSYAEKVTRDMRTLIDQLTTSNRELDDFAYIASHDLKEPLRGMQNHSDHLLKHYSDVLDDEGQRKLGRVIYLGQHMNKLVSDLLYYSRLGRSEEAEQQTDIGDLLIEMKKTILATSDDAGGLQITIAENLPRILCHTQSVKELFDNLIQNAIKYNENHPKIVECGVIENYDSKTKNVFYVKDNGIGIDAKHHEAIFKIFKRLHRKDAYGGGTGSGLTFARKIISRHDGKIWVESKIGSGSTFYFTLNMRKKNYEQSSE